MEELRRIKREVGEALGKMHQASLNMAQQEGYVTGPKDGKKGAIRGPNPISAEDLHATVEEHMADLEKQLKKMGLLKKALERHMSGNTRGSFHGYNGLTWH